MGFILRLALVFSLSIAYKREGPLYDLTDADYDQFLSEFRNDLRVVLLYSPFVQLSSKNYVVEYFSVCKDLSAQAHFAKLNFQASSDPQFKARFNYKVPSIIYCRGKTDKCEEFNGELTKENVKKFISNKIYDLPTLSKFEEVDEIEKKYKNSAVVLGVFEEFSGEKYELFVNFTYHYVGEYNFMLAKEDGQYAHRFGLKEDSIVVLHGNNLKTEVYPSNWVLSNYKTDQDIFRFVQWTYYPYVAFMDHEVIRGLKNGQVPLGVLYLDTDKYSSQISFFVNKLAENSKDKLSILYEPKKYQFTLANIKEFSGELNNLALSGVDLIFLMHFNGQIYKLDKTCFYDSEVFIDDCIRNFYEQYERQELTEYIKSEPLPTLNYDKGVRVAVAQTFLQLIDSKSAIHAVYVYTPSQKDYKKKLSTIESMANHYKKDYRIDFIKINAAKNTVPKEFAVSDSGKLFIIDKKNKKFVEHRSDWDYMKIHGFINTHLEYKKSDL